jgi:Undecaprenyl-phosphate glucose phosphotransferase
MLDLAVERTETRGAPSVVSEACQRRIDIRGVLLASNVLEIVLILATGIVCYHVYANGLEPIFAVIAAYTATLAFALLPPADRSPAVVARCSAIGHAATAMFMTAIPFLLSTALLVAFLPAAADGHSSSMVGWLISWGAAAVAGVGSVRSAQWALVRRWRARGSLRQHVAIVGAGDLAERLVRWLHRSCAETVHVIGVFDDRTPGLPGRTRLDELRLGNVDHLIETAKSTEIDRVIVALPHSAERRLTEILKKLKAIPADISLAPDHAGFTARSSLPDEYDGLPLINVYGRPLEFEQQLLKTMFDRVLAAMALVFLSPFLVGVAIAIKLDSPGSVLFTQDRYGYGNRIIRVYKFRTMRSDLTDHGGRRQTKRNDPRVTRIGRFLRKTSIDELPQLINVLRGDMSLIGPRPLPVHMRVEDRLNHEIVSEYAHRHRVKPGLTGWAQVNGYRGAVATPAELRARVEHDLFYIDNWSFLLDMKILLRTAGVCLGHENAF